MTRAEEGTRKGLQKLGPKTSHLSEVARGPYALPGVATTGEHLFTTDAGEGAEAQGHFVKAETEIVARNACMGIYKSSG